MPHPSNYKARRFEQVLLGTAVGDSLGLPAEGLSPQSIAKRWHGEWRQRLIFGHGMVSDDTEHTVFAAKCLLRNRRDVEKFQCSLAWCFRGWFASLPPGIGLATARAIIKLWLGFPPGRSGVFSAGNGPAMRSAIIGVFFAGEPEKILPYVRASTRLTHTDPRAEIAARAVALTAAHAVQAPSGQPMRLEDLLTIWRSAGAENAEWLECIALLEKAASNRARVAELAEDMGLHKGITGYAFHTVPMALYSFHLNAGDFRKTLEDILNCGGDTDSAGAIGGALAALLSDIPLDWIDGIVDWPLSPYYLRQLARALESGQPEGNSLRWALLPVRNLFLLGVVLIHGLGRAIL